MFYRTVGGQCAVLLFLIAAVAQKYQHVFWIAKSTVCGKGLDVKDSQIFSDVNSIPTHELHLLQLPLEMRDNSLVKVSSNVMVVFCHQQRERLVTNRSLAGICHSYYHRHIIIVIICLWLLYCICI